MVACFFQDADPEKMAQRFPFWLGFKSTKGGSKVASGARGKRQSQEKKNICCELHAGHRQGHFKVSHVDLAVSQHQWYPILG